MFCTRERNYNIDKPPIILIERRELFTCAECTLPGYGPPGTLVHAGKCRDARTRKLVVRAREKRRRKAQLLAVPIAC